ncbi:hypothetical protein HPB49_024603 [Dermacentor silvarum]|uniref:Uncharacterized protein n=1 Tax=Dermacentor silvarum TaxID=543639 RepID=A0ACB8CNK7_DERSI|nr:hypothetical protein HPB49_024603 [Dermacentor silvarum]
MPLKGVVEVPTGTPLYRHYGITVDSANLDAIPRTMMTAVRTMKNKSSKPLKSRIPPIASSALHAAMNAVTETVVYDANATADHHLLEGSFHYLAIAPGEGQVPISLLYDEHTEELSFSQIYLGQPRKIRGQFATPFAKVSSEIRRTDRRGVESAHVLCMAMNVMRCNIVKKTVTFRTNDHTRATTQQLESGEFMREALDRGMAFMRGIPNTIHYW